MKRRSEAGISTSEDFNLKLFENALNDPLSKHLILKLLESKNTNIFELFNNKPQGDKALTPVKRVKRKEHCESPTALLRRRELEKINRPESAQSDTSEQSTTSGRSSTLPFEKILLNVKAFVEIRSNGTDRSGGAKALLRSMGATVRDQFTRDVTHVIFKDGSYQTYQRAKLLKVHFVSVLWLECVRRNGVHVPEKNYPALGTKNHDQNISLICSQMQKDYEDVIREEIRRTLDSGNPLPNTKSLMGSRRRTIASTSRRFDTSSEMPNSNNIQDMEVANILSKIRGHSNSQEPSTPNLLQDNMSPLLTEDVDSNLSTPRGLHTNLRPLSLTLEQDSDILSSDSECAVVNGDFSRRLIINDTLGDSISKDSSNMEITCSEDKDNMSRLHIENRLIPYAKTKNWTEDMEMTNLNTDVSSDQQTHTHGVLKNLGASILNSISSLASKTQILTQRIPKKRKLTEKENCKPPTHDTVDTAKKEKLATKKSETESGKVKQNLLLKFENTKYNEDFPDEISRPSLRLPHGSKKYKPSKNANRDSSEIFALLIPSDNSKEKRSSNDSNIYSTQMSTLHISSDISKENIPSSSNRTSSEMSALQVSSDSRKRISSSISSLKLSRSVTDKSSEMSALQVSSDSRKRISSSISSLKLSKSVTDKSSEISALQVSSDSRKRCSSISSLKLSKSITDKSSEISALQVSSDSRKRCSSSISSSKQSKSISDKSGSTNMSSLRVSSELDNLEAEKEAGTNDAPIEKSRGSTQFVTERKKKTNIKGTHNDLPKNDEANQDLKASRRSRRISLAVNKEKRDFDMDLKNRKDFHDQNREIELHSDEKGEKEELLTPVKKHFLKTPLKSDVYISPFVNTRPRRTSLRSLPGEGENCSFCHTTEENTVESSKRRTGKIDDESVEEKLSQDEAVQEEYANLIKSGQLVQLNKKEDTRKPTDPAEQEINVEIQPRRPRKTTINKITNVADKSDTSSLKATNPCENRAIVLLENVLISPPKSTSNSKRKTLSKSDRQCTSPSNSVSSRSIDPKLKEKIYKPKSDVVNKISRTRKSRKFRKLFDPENVDASVFTSQTSQVNDDEEREKVRKEKVTKVNSSLRRSCAIGNVLLTKNALNYLEHKNNQKLIASGQISTIENKEISTHNDSTLDSSGDEQVELADRFVHKKFQVPSQIDTATPTKSNNRKRNRILSQKALTALHSKRRSSLEFQPRSLRVAKVKTKRNLDQKPSIVCTKMHKPDVQMFTQIVRKLGTFDVEDEVTSRTTHLVVGELLRTINLLRALARGCWILKQDWLLGSLEQRKWLPEEQYEVTDFSPAVQKCRLERLAFGQSYTMNIFLECGPIFVAKSTTPRSSDLRELIIICRGKITKSPDNAKIVVGAYLEDCQCVDEYWILDSIQAAKLKPLKKYLIEKKTAARTVKSPFV